MQSKTLPGQVWVPAQTLTPHRSAPPSVLGDAKGPQSTSRLAFLGLTSVRRSIESTSLGKPISQDVRFPLHRRPRLPTAGPEPS